MKFSYSETQRRLATGGTPIMRRGSDIGVWMSVCNYVAASKDIRSAVCRSCFSGKIYDKNNVVYVFDRTFTIDQIKELIEKVRKINSPDE